MNINTSTFVIPKNMFGRLSGDDKNKISSYLINSLFKDKNIGGYLDSELCPDIMKITKEELLQIININILSTVNKISIFNLFYSYLLIESFILSVALNYNSDENKIIIDEFLSNPKESLRNINNEIYSILDMQQLLYLREVYDKSKSIYENICIYINRLNNKNKFIFMSLYNTEPISYALAIYLFYNTEENPYSIRKFLNFTEKIIDATIYSNSIIPDLLQSKINKSNNSRILKISDPLLFSIYKEYTLIFLIQINALGITKKKNLSIKNIMNCGLVNKIVCMLTNKNELANIHSTEYRSHILNLIQYPQIILSKIISTDRGQNIIDTLVDGVLNKSLYHEFFDEKISDDVIFENELNAQALYSFFYFTDEDSDEYINLNNSISEYNNNNKVKYKELLNILRSDYSSVLCMALFDIFSKHIGICKSNINNTLNINKYKVKVKDNHISTHIHVYNNKISNNDFVNNIIEGYLVDTNNISYIIEKYTIVWNNINKLIDFNITIKDKIKSIIDRISIPDFIKNIDLINTHISKLINILEQNDKIDSIEINKYIIGLIIISLSDNIKTTINENKNEGVDIDDIIKYFDVDLLSVMDEKYIVDLINSYTFIKKYNMDTLFKSFSTIPSIYNNNSIMVCKPDSLFHLAAGKLTGCCQWYEGQAKKDTYISLSCPRHNTIYFIKNNKIHSQAFVYLHGSSIILDSIETRHYGEYDMVNALIIYFKNLFIKSGIFINKIALRNKYIKDNDTFNIIKDANIYRHPVISGAYFTNNSDDNIAIKYYESVSNKFSIEKLSDHIKYDNDDVFKFKANDIMKYLLDSKSVHSGASYNGTYVDFIPSSSCVLYINHGISNHIEDLYTIFYNILHMYIRYVQNILWKVDHTNIEVTLDDISLHIHNINILDIKNLSEKIFLHSEKILSIISCIFNSYSKNILVSDKIYDKFNIISDAYNNNGNIIDYLYENLSKFKPEITIFNHILDDTKSIDEGDNND